MSNSKRLGLGFGIIVLGFCVAFSFRHSQRPVGQLNAADTPQVSLGTDVALQVPGQAEVPRFQPLPVSPVDPDPPAAETPTKPEPSHLTATEPPPSLPDQYLPLFHSASPATQTGRLIMQPSAQRNTVPRPLRQHTIHDGDTLAALAARYLDDPDLASSILAANANVLSNPDLLPIGQQIVIPHKGSQRNRSDPQPPAPSPSEQLVPLPDGTFSPDQ